ncbi:Hypothetical_protein [Hexamita inflata]|uniref:Hypothetical_protein n=1 Tax=Hexamita inflata TaxID=28002 RepID=A0AA86TAC5_9EUKA|nr:Hypothetical protein HINF_LOCUS331 [Hexamita inflata]
MRNQTNIAVQTAVQTSQSPFSHLFSSISNFPKIIKMITQRFHSEQNLLCVVESKMGWNYFSNNCDLQPLVALNAQFSFISLSVFSIQLFSSQNNELEPCFHILLQVCQQ